MAGERYKKRMTKWDGRRDMERGVKREDDAGNEKERSKN